MHFKFQISLLFILIFTASCAQQTDTKLLGGPCEGCEAVFEFEGKLSQNLTITDTKKGETLKVSGTIYKADGKTPADGIILYLYHTDAKGIYPSEANSKGWEGRHGKLRGWLKTGEDGKYEFTTIRPASYPNTSIVQHIHPTILEPDGSYYWIQDYLFDDDPFLTNRERNRSNPRGGDGFVLDLRKENGVWIGTRDIILRKGL